MPRYFITFGASRDHYPQTTEHTRVIELADPIEYDSDIALVQAWAAKEVDAKSVMLTHWRELKGRTRPEAYHCVPCRAEWPSDRPCDVCQRSAQPGRLPSPLPPVAP